jgi:hypothetical protein
MPGGHFSRRPGRSSLPRADSRPFIVPLAIDFGPCRENGFHISLMVLWVSLSYRAEAVCAY